MTVRDINQNKEAEEIALEQVRRGELGRQVLENELFKEYFIKARGDLLLRFEKTKANEIDERDEIWREVQVLNKFEKSFTRAMETGKIGKATLTKLQKFKRFVGM
jgi:hypothetical protein